MTLHNLINYLGDSSIHYFMSLATYMHLSFKTGKYQLNKGYTQASTGVISREINED